MPIVITVASIVVITSLVWLVNKILPFKVCPICAGISLTWLLLIPPIFLGGLPFTNYQLLVAILMGGTVVGIAYQGEKVFDWAAENIFKFRAPVIVIGFVLAFLALQNLSWFTLVLEGVLLAIIGYLYFVEPYRKVKSGSNLTEVKRLEEEMKNCC